MEYKPCLRFYYSETDYLNYEKLGDGEYPLIFLHGFGASLRNWDDVVLNLPGDKFTLYLIDLKGSGFSSKPRHSDYSIMIQASLVSAFIEYYDLSGYSLIGHSLGGGVALLVALDAIENSNQKPEKMVLIDTAAYEIKMPFFVENLRMPIINQLILNFTSSKFRSKYTLDRIFYCKKKITPEIIERYAYFSRLQGYNHAIISTAKQIIPKNLKQYASKYAKMDVPVLVIWGREDTVLPLASGKQLVQDLPVAKLHVIDESGHNPQEEHPKEVAELIKSFVLNLP